MDTMVSESERFAKYAPVSIALERAATHCLEAADAAATGNRAGMEWSLEQAQDMQRMALDALLDADAPSLRERVAGIIRWATGMSR